MGKDVIIACDFSSKKETMAFLEKFGQRRPYVKIGMELYYAEGPAIVRELKERGHKVFLDLKLHDIPNTVKKAMRVLSGMDIDMCNVHAGGTIARMEAALEGLRRGDGHTSASHRSDSADVHVTGADGRRPAHRRRYGKGSWSLCI